MLTAAHIEISSPGYRDGLFLVMGERPVFLLVHTIIPASDTSLTHRLGNQRGAVAHEYALGFLSTN